MVLFAALILFPAEIKMKQNGRCCRTQNTQSQITLDLTFLVENTSHHAATGYHEKSSFSHKHCGILFEVQLLDYNAVLDIHFH